MWIVLRYQKVIGWLEIEEMFGFEGVQWPAFDFYQTKVGKETDFTSEDAPVGSLVYKLKSVLQNKISPNYNKGELGAYLNFPKNRTQVYPMNEELATYATMYYMSELVRYRPDYLYSILESEASWLFQSFVKFCPLKFLRAMVGRIIQPSTGEIVVVVSH